jgi:hypothetical protein
MPDVADARAVPSHPGVPVTPGVLADPGFTDSGNVDELAVGSWIELLVNGVWTRTQLSWASPHGTLFLFTNAAGTTQSITRRSRDRLMNAGQLRVISGRPMVDGAFDAVAQTALRNSVNRPL